MRRPVLICLAFVATAAACGAATSHAQASRPAAAIGSPTAPADSNAVRARLWAALIELEQLQVQTGALAAAASGDPSALEGARPLFEQEALARADVELLLEEVVFETTWGARELDALRRAFPASLLLVEYDARLAVLQGRLADARRLYDRLLTDAPRSADLQRAMADVQERAGDGEEARMSYARVLELQPEDEAAFRALVRLHGNDGSLPALLARVERLQLRMPESVMLIQHQIELLHRLGRHSEAEAVARALKERGHP